MNTTSESPARLDQSTYPTLADDATLRQELQKELQKARERKTAADRGMAVAYAQVAQAQAEEAAFRDILEAAQAAIRSNNTTGATAKALGLKGWEADSDLIAATNKLRDSRDAQAFAQAEVQAAEQAMMKAGEAILIALSFSIASRIEQHIEEAIRLGRQLREHTPDDTNMPLNQMRAQPQLVRRALAQLAKLQPDGIYRPIGESETNMAAMGVFPVSTYHERLAALMRGDVAADVAEETAA